MCECDVHQLHRCACGHRNLHELLAPCRRERQWQAHAIELGKMVRVKCFMDGLLRPSRKEHRRMRSSAFRSHKKTSSCTYGCGASLFQTPLAKVYTKERKINSRQSCRWERELKERRRRTTAAGAFLIEYILLETHC